MSDENNTIEENKVEDKAPEAPAETAEVKEAPAEEAVKVTPAEETTTKEAIVEETPAVKTDKLPYRNLKPGMVVRVHEVIKDVNAKGEERERVQIFEGTILGFGGSGISRTVTVRKVSNGIGVEKIYPLSSPHVADIEVVKVHKIRRAKFWFLRKGRTKRRMKEIQQ